MKILLIAVVIILVVAGVFVFKENPKNASSGESIINPTQLPQTQSMTTATVTVGPAGFEPQSQTVKVGTKVVWTNKSGADDVTVNSDEHPTHLIYPPLNLGQFNDQSSVELVFDKEGAYNYHNHLNPSQKGTIIVTP
ncbi:MAG: cupredoxin domain-containing protein [Candidatus Levybacteria bacterium]|nr:cupredoxin domain-containing protein [Candidatus Levybacteria bacterium]